MRTYNIHWHVLLTHFPISLFGAAFLFQVLHLFAAPACFEMATNVTAAAGAAMMIPTTWTGWSTWKRAYKGAVVPLFQRKISIAFAMLSLSIPLTVWRFAYLPAFEREVQGMEHWIYLAGNSLLIAGAVAEGLYGARLNHH